MNTLLATLADKGELKVMPDNAQYKNRFQIKSESSNRLYVVAQKKSSLGWCCSCPGWISRRDCKHLKSLQPLLNSLKNDEQKQLAS